MQSGSTHGVPPQPSAPQLAITMLYGCTAKPQLHLSVQRRAILVRKDVFLSLKLHSSLGLPVVQGGRKGPVSAFCFVLRCCSWARAASSHLGGAAVSGREDACVCWVGVGAPHHLGVTGSLGDLPRGMGTLAAKEGGGHGPTCLQP